MTLDPGSESSDGDGDAIVATGLTKTYGSLVALDAIDLSVRYGECFALLGPNGAGKTTATEIFEGYRYRDAGDVTVLGVDPQRATASWRARIGIVLQSASDLADLTVAETVAHFGGMYPDPRPVDEVIDAVGLEAKRNERCGDLSGGQRRRLDVALGIVGRPDLLFLDEPTTGFDPEARRSFWELIERLKAEGTTILLTTHYLDEAERLADRLAVIAGGRVLDCDTPDRIGGRSEATALVEWTADGRVLAEQTLTPTEVIRRLSEQFGGEVPGLRVSRPTLEDVYLSMIQGQAAAV